MGTFTQCTSDWLCGPTFTDLLISRASSSQNAYGEVVLSFASVAIFKLDIQPLPIGGLIRDVHGQLVQASFLTFAHGNPDIRELDRAYISNTLIEVIGVDRWGDHAEIFWKYVR